MAEVCFLEGTWGWSFKGIQYIISRSTVTSDCFFLYTECFANVYLSSQSATIGPPCFPSGRESFLAKVLMAWRTQPLQQRKHCILASPSSAPRSPGKSCKQEVEEKERRAWRNSQRKPEACLRLRCFPPKLWVLIALLFNLSEEYVGEESTTSPSCYFVTTLQNT